MKVITLYQLWATLVASGAKKIKTRSRATKYRGPLAIHAAKKPWKLSLVATKATRMIERIIMNQTHSLPYGAIIAVCCLADVYNIGDGMIYKKMPNGSIDYGSRIWLSEEELAFGNYTPGCYALILEGVRLLPEPIPVRGKQGLWSWEVPNE